MKVIDMHCDTIMKIYDSEIAGEYQGLSKNSYQIDREKLQAGNYLLQNFALFLDKESVEDPYNHAMEMVQCFKREMARNESWIAQVTTVDEILANEKAGKISALLTMEEGAPLEGDAAKLQAFYDLGVRMLTLTWNYPNELGYPNAAFYDEAKNFLSAQQKGLTKTGIEIVQQMEALGMIIDVSHGSDQLVRDVLTYTKAPFVASHSNARIVTNHFRNLSDELIKEIANRGGVIGMNFCDLFLRGEDENRSLIDSLVLHVKHIKNVGGIECIGLGSDFDGIPVVEELADASVMPQILQALQKEFTTTELEKISNQNVLRLYGDCLK